MGYKEIDTFRTLHKELKYYLISIDVKGIVLAAGKGTRLYPITDIRPKPLLEIAGKSMVQRILESLEKLGINEIFVVVHTEKEMMIDSIKRLNIKAKITFVDQGEALGTGHAALKAIEMFDDDDFLVVNGDVLVDFLALKKARELFESETSISGVLVGAEVENPKLYGVLIQEGNNLIELLEKPEDIESSDLLINAGVYIFSKEERTKFFNIQPSPKGELEIVSVINMILKEKKKFLVSKMQEKWFDIGYPWHLLEANSYLLEKESPNFEVRGDVEKPVTLIGRVHIEKGARIRAGVYIEGPVYIDEGADVGPNCYIRKGTFLGKNTRVGNGCEIKNSIFYEGTHAGHLSYVGDSILGKNCNLGAGTKTANLRHDGKAVKMTVKGERVSTGRRKLGVIMGDNVKTGINVSLMPGVKISANSMIMPGVVVNRDV